MYPSLLRQHDTDAGDQSINAAQSSGEDNNHKRQDAFPNVSLCPNSSAFSVLFICKYYTVEWHWSAIDMLVPTRGGDLENYTSRAIFMVNRCFLEVEIVTGTNFSAYSNAKLVL